MGEKLQVASCKWQVISILTLATCNLPLFTHPTRQLNNGNN